MFTLMRRMPMTELSMMDCGLKNIMASVLNEGNAERPRFSRFLRPSETEIFSKDNQLYYRLPLPGIDLKDIELSVENNVLKVKAERRQPSQVDEKDWHARSFHYGHFEQTCALPKDANPEEVSADFKNGVLEIRVPINKAVLSRKIEVKQLESAPV
jgi:HSP20 family protein